MLKNSASVTLFLSTLSLRRATCARLRACLGCFYFYPRSPCGERHLTKYHFTGIFTFLSTLSLRRATTASGFLIGSRSQFLSTLSLRRATEMISIERCSLEISIHALLAESDSLTAPQQLLFSVFLSTLSLRRATCFRIPYWFKVTISIHALLAESDN